MASLYPGGLDSIRTDIQSNTSERNVHAPLHNLIADAVNKIEAELGINPSGSLTDLVTRLGVSQNTDGTLKRSAVQTVLGSISFNVKRYGAVGDGTTDDTAAINAAISDYNAAGGGILYFPKGSGNFYLSQGGHRIAAPGLIVGDGGPQSHTGWGASALQLKTGGNQSMLLIASQGVTVADLSLYGDKANQTGTSHGIQFDTTATLGLNYFKFVRLWISGFLTDGILIQTTTGSGSIGGAIQDCESRLNGRYGINLASGADCTITNTLTDQNGGSGLLLATSCILEGVHSWGNGTDSNQTSLDGARIIGGYVRATNCYFESNIGCGVQGPNSNNNVFVGCDFFNNRRQGMYLFNSKWTTISGCTFRNNGQASIAGITSAGLTLDTCTACTTTGSMFFDDKAAGFKHQTYGYTENGNTCIDCKVSNIISRAIDHLTGDVLVGINTIFESRAATTVKTGNYTATLSDEVILADGTGSAFTVTLPTAVGVLGKQYDIKKTDATTNSILVATTSSQTIDGSSTFALVSRESITVISDGTNWQII